MFLVGFHWLCIHIMDVRMILCIDNVMAIPVLGCRLQYGVG